MGGRRSLLRFGWFVTGTAYSQLRMKLCVAPGVTTRAGQSGNPECCRGTIDRARGDAGSNDFELVVAIRA